jgi:hypothetical protein
MHFTYCVCQMASSVSITVLEEAAAILFFYIHS